MRALIFLLLTLIALGVAYHYYRKAHPHDDPRDR
jgi:hypothetical protein